MHPDAIWPGLVGGLAIGLFSLFQLRLTGRALGCSTGYGNLCSFVSRTQFFHTGTYADRFNWRLWFTLGLPAGGLLAVLLHGDGFVPSVDLGPLYESVMPAAGWARALVLFA